MTFRYVGGFFSFTFITGAAAATFGAAGAAGASDDADTHAATFAAAGSAPAAAACLFVIQCDGDDDDGRQKNPDEKMIHRSFWFEWHWPEKKF